MESEDYCLVGPEICLGIEICWTTIPDALDTGPMKKYHYFENNFMQLRTTAIRNVGSMLGKRLGKKEYTKLGAVVNTTLKDLLKNVNHGCLTLPSGQFVQDCTVDTSHIVYLNYIVDDICTICMGEK